MCGICGMAYSDRSRAPEVARVAAMNAALSHRGPDDSGLWADDSVALAMRRLGIIDLARGRQPFLSDNGQLALVYNGEVYNFRELRRELEERGHTFRTLCDTEVVLHAYEEFGDDALNRLNGMFAFALYDRTRQRLLVARDHIGIKPLFYSYRNGRLLFASELDALLQSGLIDGTMNPAALDAYFTYLYIPAPDTILRDVQQLPPGHKLVLERGNIRVESYWEPELDLDPTWSLESSAERYTELLLECVRNQCVSDVPLGAFLSGGVDSSAVVAAMCATGGARVQTFSIGFDDAHANELRFARLVAEHFGTDHVEEIMKPDAVEIAATLIRHFGQPFADSSAVPTWLVSRLARRHVTVALSGDGGDELFAGYTWLHMARNVHRYRQVPAPVRRTVDAALGFVPSSPMAMKVRRFSRDSFLAPLEAYRRRQTCFDATQRARLFQPDVADRVAACGVDRFREHADRASSLDYDNWMLRQDFVMYLPDDILTKVDRMSMAVSLEARVPLLDLRMVAFANSLPLPLKLDGGISKRVAKKALSNFLPADVLKQRKRGFAVPIQRWFREELRSHFQDCALSSESRLRGYLAPDAVKGLFDAHVARQDDLGHHLWAVLMFEHWLRYAESIPGFSPALP
ncbi:MAG: asparagine synthase (glutamine-hydrolyzing) [Candidatus Hydrogenedentes bacterium]|nr:asparagine synthase (glutamine-hydrolyzing) [Candidatus Hydrogenedentota bacterium]